MDRRLPAQWVEAISRSTSLQWPSETKGHPTGVVCTFAACVLAPFVAMPFAPSSNSPARVTSGLGQPHTTAAAEWKAHSLALIQKLAGSKDEHVERKKGRQTKRKARQQGGRWCRTLSLSGCLWWVHSGYSPLFGCHLHTKLYHCQHVSYNYRRPGKGKKEQTCNRIVLWLPWFARRHVVFFCFRKTRRSWLASYCSLLTCCCKACGKQHSTHLDWR